MKGRNRPEYFFIAVLLAIICIVGTVMLSVLLGSAKAVHHRLDDEGEDIAVRAGALIGSNEEVNQRVSDSISDGMYSVGDYVMNVMTSTDYLMEGPEDDVFVNDLCTVLYGAYDSSEAEDMLGDLEKHSRMYVIDKYIRDVDKHYGITGEIDEDGISSFSDCDVQCNFVGESGYTIGIKELKGTIRLDGEEVRTDFFVDGTLYRGYLNMSEEKNSEGLNEFLMAWDTAGTPSGEHKAYVLVRSSDGRGKLIGGGDIYIPSCANLANDKVLLGSLYSGDDSSWYLFDSGDRDAYVNFVNLSDDISVSIYDAFGDLIGTNDIPGNTYEVLRAHKQDVDAISQETGIEGVSNAFYVEVRRGAGCLNPDNDINYTMVQTENVAYYSGSYMAVMSEQGAVPTPVVGGDSSELKDATVKLTDLNQHLYEPSISEVSFLPLNGFLADLSISASNGTKFDLWPDFKTGTQYYAYYLNTGVELDVNALPMEGYSSEITVSTRGAAGDKTYTNGDKITLPKGASEVEITVNAFNGDSHTYTVYFLVGSDDAGFYRTTLRKFPQSYYSGLWLLHSMHPDYVFEAYEVDEDFNVVLENEDHGSMSLMQYSVYPEYCKPDSQVYDAPDWMAVKREVVSYYMDPRNFLIPDRVFMFEQLSFNSDVHTVDGVSAIIAGSFMDTDDYDYAQVIYDAGEESGVSPYFLASRIIQEMGYSGQSNLAHGTVEGYEGYYNYYNIGAYATTAEGGPVRNGARYARWGKDPDGQEITEAEAAIMLPWDSIDKAITGGAMWIASGYIDVGQDTLYFQKFDVVDNGTDFYNHQYAQSIMMAYSESKRYYNSYSSIGRLDSGFVFEIPVYNNMPEDYGYLPGKD